MAWTASIVKSNLKSILVFVKHSPRVILTLGRYQVLHNLQDILEILKKSYDVLNMSYFYKI